MTFKIGDPWPIDKCPICNNLLKYSNSIYSCVEGYYENWEFTTYQDIWLWINNVKYIFDSDTKYCNINSLKNRIDCDTMLSLHGLTLQEFQLKVELLKFYG